MEQDHEKTQVVFRKWGNGDVIALFPGIKENGGLCRSYVHIGQHGAADYNNVIAQTKPAPMENCKALIDELISIGYNLTIRKRR